MPWASILVSSSKLGPLFIWDVIVAAMFAFKFAGRRSSKNPVSEQRLSLPTQIAEKNLFTTVVSFFFFYMRPILAVVKNQNRFCIFWRANWFWSRVVFFDPCG